MCKTMKHKFRCKHSKTVYLSKCLGHRSKPSVLTPGKASVSCKGKAQLKLKFSYDCPACDKDKAKRRDQDLLDGILNSTEEHLQSPDKDFQTQIRDLRDQAMSNFIVAMGKLKVPWSEAIQHNTSTGPQQTEKAEDEESDHAVDDKHQRKLDVITQWNLRRAQAMQRCPGICERPANEKCTCEEARRRFVLPLAQPKQQEEQHPASSGRTIHLRRPVQPQAPRARKRKSEETEPVCENSDRSVLSDDTIPRLFKITKLVHRESATCEGHPKRRSSSKSP